jgi:hypothetical protein
MPSDPNLDAARTARAEGREWGLVVIQNPSGTPIQLAHTLPAPNPRR